MAELIFLLCFVTEILHVSHLLAWRTTREEEARKKRSPKGYPLSSSLSSVCVWDFVCSVPWLWHYWKICMKAITTEIAVLIWGEFGCPLLTVFIWALDKVEPVVGTMQTKRMLESCCFVLCQRVWWHRLQRLLVREMPYCREKPLQAFLLAGSWIRSHNWRHLAIDYFLWFPFLITMDRNKSTLTRIKGSKRQVILFMVLREKKKNIFYLSSLCPLSWDKLFALSGMSLKDKVVVVYGLEKENLPAFGVV